MPELPEVECVRRALAQSIIGRKVVGVRVRRRDFVTGPSDREHLLVGQRIAAVERRGKQLAVVGDRGGAIVLHLGMTGRLLVRDAKDSRRTLKHVHVEWVLADTNRGDDIELLFQDARRFGGVWTFDDVGAVHDRWARELGPDGLRVTGAQLRAALGASKRAVKAALLDQRAVAGVGNIYADEALFAAAISPRRIAKRVTSEEWALLARSIRATLRKAIRCGGSTLRDYAMPDGAGGEYQRRHLVYGRGGEACTHCGETLRTAQVGQRTTVWCPKCQK
ncbi:MAG TPA: bifunctional DNA-formamidopyrimidine glycosylase/DNA-(apurinic or apyrimidinic site) lyase [Phycisphaerales bacterium]|nr:bifunctional DNA-formamidopyrimidine glycosylase/DNA-(apurinic or apyrimidinic site) lyase [Phycisphaerales bacterium]